MQTHEGILTMAYEDQTSTDHLSSEVLAAYLDRAIEAEERERIERHLLRCDACRAEVVQLRGARKRWPSLPMLPVAGGLIAAGLASVLVLGVLSKGPAAIPEPSLRGEDVVGAAEGVLRIEVLGPRGEVSANGSIEFSWRSAGPDALYVVSVMTEDGDPVWEAETRDLRLQMAESVRLQPGTPYYWLVDALVGGVRSATSGLVELMPR